MSRLLTLRKAVIDAVKATMPAGWDVAGHLGRFAPADLRTFLVKAPAARVAVLGLTDSRTIDDGEALEARVHLGVYVVARDRLAAMAREEIAAAAVESFVLMALGQRWGLTFVQPAEPATAQLIANADTLGQGVALWAIELTQLIVLERPQDGPYPITELYLGLAPEVGPDHIADYIGPIAVTGEIGDE